MFGFGDAVDNTQLAKMADWGSGNTLDHHPAQNQDQFTFALETLLLGLPIDLCCAFNDCVGPPDPDSNGEADPVPIETTSTSSSTTSESTTTPTTTATSGRDHQHSG